MRLGSLTQGEQLAHRLGFDHRPPFKMLNPLGNRQRRINRPQGERSPGEGRLQPLAGIAPRPRNGTRLEVECPREQPHRRGTHPRSVADLAEAAQHGGFGGTIGQPFDTRKHPFERSLAPTLLDPGAQRLRSGGGGQRARPRRQHASEHSGPHEAQRAAAFTLTKPQISGGAQLPTGIIQRQQQPVTPLVSPQPVPAEQPGQGAIPQFPWR